MKLLKNNNDDLYYTATADVTGFNEIKEQKVEFYVTAVDKSGNEPVNAGQKIPCTYFCTRHFPKTYLQDF